MLKSFELFILLICSFAAAIVSGTAGFGGSLLLLPVVTIFIGAEAAVPVLAIAQLIGNLARMATGFRQIDWKSVGWFSLSALPLAALGAFGFALLPKDAVTRCIGAGLVMLAVAKLLLKKDLPKGKGTLLAGGALTGGLSGLCGSGGPIGAAAFLSLGLSPVAYIASEAAGATAMHILKIVVYSRLTNMTLQTLTVGAAMGCAMLIGTFAAKYFIKGMTKNKFQIYVASILCLVGLFMLIFGA